MSQFQSQFEEKLYNERREKLTQIAGLMRQLDPTLATDLEAKYPNSFRFTHTVPDLRAIGNPLDTDALAATKIEAAIAGRIMAIRVQGKAGFAQIQQGGQRLQIYVRKDDVGETAFALYKLLDLGDHIGVRGFLMRTRTGELTLHAAPLNDAPTITFLSKSMLALPDKYHGLEDTELRYRQRYVDLIVNTGNTPAASSAPATPSQDPSSRNEAERSASPEQAPTLQEDADDTPNVRETFVKRAAILRALRKFFDTRNYLEVETPMLHTVAGGAAARPFKTHHNALDIPLSLRIAPELYLKRLVVGGLDRVYEINRNFRNEGVSTRHNPEFTMLEFYQAYANYHDLMNLTEELITFIAKEVNGTTITNFNGNEIDLSKWTKLSMREAIIKWWPANCGPAPTPSDFDNPEALSRVIYSAESTAAANFPEVGWGGPFSDPPTVGEIAVHESAHIHHFGKRIDAGENVGKVIAELFEHLAEEHLIQPTIIYDFPLAVSPLSKVKPSEPDWVERFEFYIGGFEVGNAFSELNDPDDQRDRFLDQLKEKERGDDEAHAMDEDYVRALGYGLPPTAGEGIGIDRLTMLLTESKSIRDVILFPLMRPTKASISEDDRTDEPNGESAE